MRGTCLYVFVIATVYFVTTLFVTAFDSARCQPDFYGTLPDVSADSDDVGGRLCIGNREYRVEDLPMRTGRLLSHRTGALAEAR
jgi:hypothetical protein